MKRVALALASAAMAALPLFPGTAAGALAPGGYTVTRVVLPSRVFSVAVDPATGLVYVGRSGTVYGQGAVTVVDSASQAIEGSITVSGTPLGMAVDPATDTVYVASPAGVTVIDGATNQVITTIAVASVGSVGGQVAVDPATNTVYAATVLANNVRGVAVIDGAKNSITTEVPLTSTTGFVGLAVDAATDTVYAGMQNGILSAINGSTDTVTKSVQLVSLIRISRGIPCGDVARARKSGWVARRRRCLPGT